MNRFLENIVSIPLWVLLFIPTRVQHEMTQKDKLCKKLKKATYREIKEQLLRVDWTFNPNYPYSLFTKEEGTCFHASIFCFKGVGYMLTPYGYLQACLLQRKIRKHSLTLTGILISFYKNNF